MVCSRRHFSLKCFVVGLPVAVVFTQTCEPSYLANQKFILFDRVGKFSYLWFWGMITIVTACYHTGKKWYFSIIKNVCLFCEILFLTKKKQTYISFLFLSILKSPIATDHFVFAKNHLFKASKPTGKTAHIHVAKSGRRSCRADTVYVRAGINHLLRHKWCRWAKRRWFYKEGLVRS